MSDFARALDFTLLWEGGYVNHPSDPGGATKYGISQRSYPELDIKSLTRDEAGAIYRRDYWDRLNLDAVPWPLCAAAFDYAVNSGCERARAALFEAQAYPDPADGARSLTNGRTLFLIGLAARSQKMEAFLTGWMRRMVGMLRLISAA